MLFLMILMFLAPAEGATSANTLVGGDGPLGADCWLEVSPLY